MSSVSAVRAPDGRLAPALANWCALALAVAIGFVMLLPLRPIATWWVLILWKLQDKVRRLNATQRSLAML